MCDVNVAAATGVLKTVVAIEQDPVEHLVLEVLEEAVEVEVEVVAEAEVGAAGEVVDFRVPYTSKSKSRIRT